jgi:hypothetical protein
MFNTGARIIIAPPPLLQQRQQQKPRERSTFFLFFFLSFFFLSGIFRPSQSVDSRNVRLKLMEIISLAIFILLVESMNGFEPQCG